MRHIVAVPSLLILLASPAAFAANGVLISEIQPNPLGGSDVGEYIEIHNTGTTAVSLEGWSLNDYTGTTMGNAEATTRWSFPSLSAIAAGQVLVIARQSAAFMANNGNMRPSWELADGMDDAMVPNLVPMGGTSAIQLANSATGDGVLLKDAMGTVIDGVEYGTLDRTVPGIPQTQVPGEGQSLIRVATTGSSNVDFRVGMPTPFVGYTAVLGPVISMPVTTPEHVRYGDHLNVRTTVTDPAGLMGVNINLATATASTGNSQQDYVQIAMTSTGATGYVFDASTQNLGPGISPTNPADFHSLFIRYYISADNNNGQSSTEPTGASETSDNTAFVQKNVMPTAPSTIMSVREQNANQAPVWAGLSATVRGTVLAKPSVLSPNRTDIAIEDASGWAIRVFNTNAPMVDVQEGQVIEAVGTITQFRGVMELGGNSSYSLVQDMTGTVATTTVTIAELLANPEPFESRLVYIEDVEFMDPTTDWPTTMMMMQGNVTVKDATGTITVHITPGSNLGGTPAPQYGFDLTGIFGQFTSETTGTMGGYQINPRGAEDIEAHPMPPPPDAGVIPDSGVHPDASSGNADAGSGTDSGTGGAPADDGGCGCTTGSGSGGGFAAFAFVALIAGLALARGKKRR